MKFSTCLALASSSTTFVPLSASTSPPSCEYNVWKKRHGEAVSALMPCVAPYCPVTCLTFCSASMKPSSPSIGLRLPSLSSRPAWPQIFVL